MTAASTEMYKLYIENSATKSAINNLFSVCIGEYNMREVKWMQFKKA